MSTIFTFIAFMIFIRVLILTLLRRQSEVPADCLRHEWIKKNIDDANPDLGTYLVCKVCKRLPGGGFEQS